MIWKLPFRLYRMLGDHFAREYAVQARWKMVEAMLQQHAQSRDAQQQDMRVMAELCPEVVLLRSPAE